MRRRTFACCTLLCLVTDLLTQLLHTFFAAAWLAFNSCNQAGAAEACFPCCALLFALCGAANSDICWQKVSSSINLPAACPVLSSATSLRQSGVKVFSRQAGQVFRTALTAIHARSHCGTCVKFLRRVLSWLRWFNNLARLCLLQSLHSAPAQEWARVRARACVFALASWVCLCAWLRVCARACLFVLPTSFAQQLRHTSSICSWSALSGRPRLSYWSSKVPPYHALGRLCRNRPSP